MVSLQKRPSVEASISVLTGVSPTYWPLTSIRAPVGCETISTFSLGLTACVCDAHPEKSRNAEARRGEKMARKRGRTQCMRVALSERSVVRLQFCAFQPAIGGSLHLLPASSDKGATGQHKEAQPCFLLGSFSFVKARMKGKAAELISSYF
jgi:hypothetical protein